MMLQKCVIMERKRSDRIIKKLKEMLTTMVVSLALIQTSVEYHLIW